MKTEKICYKMGIATYVRGGGGIKFQNLGLSTLAYKFSPRKAMPFSHNHMENIQIYHTSKYTLREAPEEHQIIKASSPDDLPCLIFHELVKDLTPVFLPTSEWHPSGHSIQKTSNGTVSNQHCADLQEG